MQLSNAPGKLLLPFANAGAKNTIPTTSQIGITAGAASLTDGFPPLTRTPIGAGGVPPSGLDMNGILYALSAALRWANAGGGYVYDGTFAADSNVGGYPKGARVLRSDGSGYWLNTTDGNTTDPETAGAVAAGWVPDLTNGLAAVTMTNANVTLTPLQYGKPIVVLSGTLTANLNLIFPTIVGEWLVVNNCTGAFTITAKTASGTGVAIPPGNVQAIYGDGTNVGPFTPTHGVQRFTTNGTFTVPAGVSVIYVSGVAGGGGGGSGAGSNASAVGGGGAGGGNGDYIISVPYAVTPGQAIPITIGGGGSGGAAAGWGTAGNNGTAGGNTVIGSFVTLTGGGYGGGGATGATVGNAGAVNGFNNGGNGTPALSGNSATGYGGDGGDGPFGGAGKGGASNGNQGTGGHGFGTGGSGGGGNHSLTNSNGAAGNNGEPGLVIIQW